MQVWTWTPLTSRRARRVLTASARSQRPWPWPGQLRNEADEGELALAGSRKSSSSIPTSPAGLVADREELDLGVVDDRSQLGVGHDQP